jgi:hypothetical protein
MHRTAAEITERPTRQHRHERWLRDPRGRLRLPGWREARWSDRVVGLLLLGIAVLVLFLGR